MKTIQGVLLTSILAYVNVNFATGQSVDDCVAKIFDRHYRLALSQVDEYEDYAVRHETSLSMLLSYELKADSIKGIVSKLKVFELGKKDTLLTLVSLAVNEVSGDAYQYAKNCESALIVGLDEFVAVRYIYELERKYINEKRIKDDADLWARNLCRFVIEDETVDSGVHPKDSPPLASDAEIKFYKLKKREVVADIGAKLGTFERSVAKLGKNLSIYVCEMHGLRLDQLRKRLTVRQIMEDNGTTFKCLLATKESFDLPENVIDKALIRSHFHDFWREEWILFNVKKSLRKGGKLFITDMVSEDDNSAMRCPNVLSKQRLIELVEGHGFNFVRETKLPNSDRRCFLFKMR